MSTIRVLVVDDSAFMRKMVADILSRHPDILVVGTCRNGQECLERLAELAPDVITMDVEMPVMDGIEALRRIMESRPTPVVMLSSLTDAGAEVTMRALQMGAVDFVRKPSGSISLDIEDVADEIVSKVRGAAQCNLKSLSSKPASVLHLAPRGRSQAVPTVKSSTRPGSAFPAVVAIGTSTGGPRALQEVIPRLPADLEAPVVIVQHMPPKFTKSLAERLDLMSRISVKEAEQGDALRAGLALLAPGGHHMRVDGQDRIRLSDEAPLWGVRPAADLLIESVALRYGPIAVGVIMTGMGQDGARALKLLRERGGFAISESRETCVIYGMPRAAEEMGAVDQVVPLYEIADAIVRAVRSRA